MRRVRYTLASVGSRVASASGLAAVVLTAMELTRIASGRAIIPQPVPGTIPMPLGGAIGNLVASLAVVGLATGRHVKAIRVCAVLGAGTVLVGCVLSILFNFWKPDAAARLMWLAQTRPIGGLTGVLQCTALVLTSRQRHLSLSNVLSGSAMTIAGAVLLGYIYGGRLFVDPGRPPINLASALITTCNMIGLMALNGSGAWPMPLFRGPSVTAMLLRWFLPFVALAVLVTDIATISLFRTYSPGIGSVVNTLLSIAIAATLVLNIGRVIDRRIDRARRDLRALSTRMNTIREQERATMARDVHDHLGQSLTVLKMDITEVRRRITRGDIAGVDRRVAEMTGLVDTAIEDVRRVATELRPPLVEEAGFIDALKAYITDTTRRTGLRCPLTIDAESIDVSPERAIALFRILQEALTNVARHAGTTNVSIRIAADRRHVVLEVRDDGSGLPPEEQRNPRGLGLVGMRDRARLFGGDVVFTGEPGRGTTVTASIPISEAE